MNPILPPPHAWRRADLEQDKRWIQPFSPAESEGLEAGLRHARATGREELDLSPADFPLPPVTLSALQRAVGATQTGLGFCLVRGLPLDCWSVEDAKLVFWGIGLHTGVARTQGKGSQVMSDVRDEGGSYRVKGGRGYNTNAELDFHCDFCDLVGLLCINQSMRGGQSIILSSMAVHDEIGRRRPDLLKLLYEPFHYSYQGAQAPGDAPWFECPIFAFKNGRFASRCNRKNVTAAHADFPEIPPLTTQQVEALDLFEEVVRDPALCYSMDFQPGDIQLMNNHVTLHSRTSFEDWPDPARRRHLLRLWLALPQGQELPDGYKDGYKATTSATVRGGLRGSAITPAFLSYEERLAAYHGMRLEREPLAA